MSNVKKSTSLRGRYKLLARKLGIPAQPKGHLEQIKRRLFHKNPGSLPDFLIIGGQKCGSTTLSALLNQHPNVEPSLVKEIHYFDMDRHYAKGPAWYKAFFPDTKKLHGNQITGEATPSMHNPIVAERTAQLLPEAKLIAIVRDPVERAVSHYVHNAVRDRFPETLEEIIAKEKALGSPSLERLKSDKELAEKYHLYSILRRGTYIENFGEWLKYYDKSALHVVFLSDLSTNTAETMQGIFDFLDLPPYDVKPISAMNTRMGKSSTSERVLEELRTYYAPYDARLAKFLGRPLSW